MKSKTTTKFIIILAVLLVALYLLYPTYKFSSLTDEQKQEMQLEDKTEYLALKSKVINLGLDLQGGMHVVLEVDIKELLDNLAKNKTESFNQILEETAAQVEITDEMLNLVEMVRPKLVVDGMFLVGLDIAGDKLMEINVFSPGGLGSAQKFEKVNFPSAVIQALERKVEYMTYYKRSFRNVEMATL